MQPDTEQHSARPRAGASSDRLVRLRQASGIEPEAVRWLWPQWLARGKVHLLAGMPGTGKTTLALSLAAVVSAGGRWPDGLKADLGDVLLWSGEDAAADTLLPRLLAAGGVANRVHFIESVNRAGTELPFEPSTDLPRLVEEARTLPRLRLIILDPLAAVANTSAHGMTPRGLRLIVDLAARLDCAVLGITHLSKNSEGRDPLDRVAGSVTFGAAARLVFTTVRPAEADSPHRLVRAKSNLGPDGGGFDYRLSGVALAGRGFDAQRVDWGAALTGTARELMDVPQADEADRELDQVERFLGETLRDGAVLTWQIKAATNAHGYSWRTVRRAKQRMNIEAVRTGFNGGRWAWQLPASDGQA